MAASVAPQAAALRPVPDPEITGLLLLTLAIAATAIWALHMFRLNQALGARQAALITELEVERDRAQDAERAKDEFLSVVGHETRTPLNGIIPVLDLIARGTDDVRQKALLKVAAYQAGALMEMMDNLATVTAGRAGRLGLCTQPTYVGAVVRKRMEAFESANRSHPVRYRFSDTTDGLFFACDAPKLLKALNALVDNAVRFTAAGHVHVEVAPTPTNGFRVCVSDTGSGMALERVAELTRPFAQADMSASRAREGLGIGLAVVKQITRAMGGSMHIQSAPGRGTRVTLDFPNTRVGHHPTLSAEGMEAAPVAPSPVQPTATPVLAPAPTSVPDAAIAVFRRGLRSAAHAAPKPTAAKALGVRLGLRPTAPPRPVAASPVAVSPVAVS